MEKRREDNIQVDLRKTGCLKTVPESYVVTVFVIRNVKTSGFANVPSCWSNNLVTLQYVNPLKPELIPICCLLALLGAHHFLHVSRIRVKLLTFRLLMSYIYIYIYMEHSFLMFLDHTQRRSSVGRTPLDE